MVDRLRWKPVFRAYQCGSTEEVLHLRPWLQDRWPSFRLALHFITPIYILDCCQPIEPHVVCYSLFLFYSPAYYFYAQVRALSCIVMLCQESLTSFRLIGLSFSHFLLPPHHLVCYVPLFSYFHLYLSFRYWSLHFIFSSLGMLILHILMHIGQSYHSLHSIMWH